MSKLHETSKWQHKMSLRRLTTCLRKRLGCIFVERLHSGVNKTYTFSVSRPCWATTLSSSLWLLVFVGDGWILYPPPYKVYIICTCFVNPTLPIWTVSIQSSTVWKYTLLGKYLTTLANLWNIISMTIYS